MQARLFGRTLGPGYCREARRWMHRSRRNASRMADPSMDCAQGLASASVYAKRAGREVISRRGRLLREPVRDVHVRDRRRGYATSWRTGDAIAGYTARRAPRCWDLGHARTRCWTRPPRRGAARRPCRSPPPRRRDGATPALTIRGATSAGRSARRHLPRLYQACCAARTAQAWLSSAPRLPMRARRCRM